MIGNNTTPESLLPEGKDNKKPNFNLERFSITPEAIKNEVEQLTQPEPQTPHLQILQRLISEIQPIDFKDLANPNKVEDFKLKNKHYLVLSIEHILGYAENNRWGLCKNNSFIYLYNGTFWAEVDKETFEKFLGEAAEKLGVPMFEARHYLIREQLFKQFLSSAYLPTPEADSSTVLINLQNGTFEISPSGYKLRPFKRSDFLTYQLQFEYNSEAKAPLFEAYLNRVLPDLERQRVLAEYLGYIFIKHGNNALKEEKALILYGTGANGKSVFFEIVNALLGAENVSSFSLQSLTNDNGYYRAKLANKLVNYASEINGKLEASIFKLLVSGEPVEARLPYGQPFILKQYAKLIFNCNELPKDVEHTNAFFRRFLIIPFDVTIPIDEQDKQLHSKIIEKELSGVFNWVLEGLSRLLKQKRFSDCEAAQKAVEQYKTESDSVLMYLNEYDYRVSLSEAMPLKNMYEQYKEYCNNNGFKSGSLKTFSQRLKSAGYELERKNYGFVVYAENRKDVF